jgi:hypothetical protein
MRIVSGPGSQTTSLRDLNPFTSKRLMSMGTLAYAVASDCQPREFWKFNFHYFYTRPFLPAREGANKKHRAARTKRPDSPMRYMNREE